MDVPPLPPAPPSGDAGAPNGGALLRGLSLLLQIEREARQAATLLELEFVLTNRTPALLPATLTLFWRPSPGGGPRLARIAGLPGVERGAPFAQWAERMLHRAATSNAGAITACRQPAEDTEWADWAPPEALWCPLGRGGGRGGGGGGGGGGGKAGEGGIGGLWLARTQPWLAGDIALAERLAETYTHAWERLDPACHRRATRTRRLFRWWPAGVALGAAAALAWPVPDTTLAPAEIVAREPLVVTAPLDGVIQAVAVAPNAPVRTGQVLFTLNETALRNRYDVAVMSQRVAEAEWHKARQLAFQDSASQAALGLLEAQIALKAAEAAFAGEMLARTTIVAGRDGVVLFADPNELRGKPVLTGERVMMIADPARAELLIWLPAAEATALAPGTAVQLFLNADPLHPIAATLTDSSYEAMLAPDGALAYRLKARLDGADAPPRIGLRGTARLAGPPVPLLQSILRRPLVVLRRWVGW